MARRSRFFAEQSAERPVDAAAQPPAPNEDGEQGAVRGPTSALTSFLREQGIRPRHAHAYMHGQAPTEEDPEPSASPVVDQDEERTPRIADREPDSDGLDGSFASTSRIALAQSTTPAKKRKGKHADPEEGSGPIKAKPGRYADRTPGHIATCSECGRKFTVTKYTPANPSGPGQLCELCAKEGMPVGTAGKSAGGAPKSKRVKRAPKASKETTEASIASLQVNCINIIAKNIEGVEALGDVGSINLDRICRIVCKHRSLVPSTLPLFLDISHTELGLYDCVHLQTDHLASIATFCPRLERLTLNFCGHLDGEVIALYAKRLTSLNYLSLHGAYLVRSQDWQGLFVTWKQSPSGLGLAMRAFLLTQSPRFDAACLAGLVDACPNLSEMRLADIGQLSDTGLGLLHSLTKLTKLEIPNAGIYNGATGESLTDEGVIALLSAVGQHLDTLDLSSNKLLSDRVLLEGVKPSCTSLKSLNISQLGNLLTSGVASLFVEWVNRGLTELKMARCIRVGDEALSAVLHHSGHSLQTLDLNSMDELRSDGLRHLAEGAPAMKALDVSFVRDVDDFVLKSFLDGMPTLQMIRVFGNNRVSDNCPRRKGVRITGQERSIIVAN